MYDFFIIDSGFDKSFYSLYPYRIYPIGNVSSHYHGTAVLKTLVFTLQQTNLFNSSRVYISSFHLDNDNSSLISSFQSLLPHVRQSSNSFLSLSLSTKLNNISSNLTSPFMHIFSAHDPNHPFFNQLSNAFSCSNHLYDADFILPISYNLFGISGNSLVTPIIAVLFASNRSLPRLIDIPSYLHQDYVKCPIIQSMPRHYPKCPKCYTNVKQTMIQCPHCGHRLK